MSNYSESDLIIPTLELLASNPGGLTTTDLIERLTDVLDPDGHDAEILAGRRDSHFSQKVRNLRSHRTLEKEGWADFDQASGVYTITPAGRNHLAANR